jgi:hypothetical protein
MSSYPDIRDVHRRNYFDYSSDNIRYPEQNLMESDELSSRRFGNLEKGFIVPPYHSNGGNGPINPGISNGPNCYYRPTRY